MRIARQLVLVPHRNLRLIDAADMATDRVNALLRRYGWRVLHARQLSDSAQSIGGNISEAFGRGTPRDRARVLTIARAEAEETIRHLSANFRATRIPRKEYWEIHNLLVVIVKMLNALIYG